MVEWKAVKPFRAWRYDKQQVDLADVVSPPYDVITPEHQEALYKRSSFNMVRIDFNKTAGDDKYQEAGHLFLKWRTDRILRQDAGSALYLHHQIFVLPDGRRITRRGFFALRKIAAEGEGAVKPHEKTLAGPKADRLKLMLQTQANLSPIFGLYSDPEKKLDQWFDDTKQKAPEYDFVAEDGNRHQLWCLTDDHIAAQVDALLASRPVIIADGHHRYETACNFLKLAQKGEVRGVEPEDASWVMMYFSNFADDGLVVLPIHRAVHSLLDFSQEALLVKLGQKFSVKPVRIPTKEDGSDPVQPRVGEHTFIVLFADRQAFEISLPRAQAAQHPAMQGLDAAIQDLDVSVLHRIILEDIMGIDAQAQAAQTNLIYWKDTQRAIDETLSGRCQATFLLKATGCAQVEKAALAGQVMPQKSTYFYPKIVTGLVINSLKSS